LTTKEEDNIKHSKMTLMSFQEALAYASTPQAEPRIGSLESLECMLKGLKRENMDNDIGKGEQGSTIGWQVKNLVHFGENI
jgi:hypothetical protein